MLSICGYIYTAPREKCDLEILPRHSLVASSGRSIPGADRDWLCTSKGCVNLLSEVKAIPYLDLGEAGERLRIHRRPDLQKTPTRTPLHEAGFGAFCASSAPRPSRHLTIVPFTPERRD
jgi:hypothetical protein